MKVQIYLRSAILLLAFLLLPHIAAATEPTVTIGVLAYRPKIETLEYFKPLFTFLARELPDQKVRLEVYSYPELEAALATNKLDFLLTNPGHYIQLRHSKKFSGAMVTLVGQEEGQPSLQLGGVIFTLGDRADINRLEHLKGKRIAVAGTGSLGGYQAQAFELIQAGIHLRYYRKLLVLCATFSPVNQRSKPWKGQPQSTPF